MANSLPTRRSSDLTDQEEWNVFDVRRPGERLYLAIARIGDLAFDVMDRRVDGGTQRRIHPNIQIVAACGLRNFHDWDIASLDLRKLFPELSEIGRASCRERVCQYV